MKNKWYKNSVFYQVYPRSFCDANGDGIGDLKGILSKVDHFYDLGIDAVWFSPLYMSPNADFGYDISDYCNINPEYGTMADFDLLVARLHDHGIKIVMDLVINHTSSQHRWFRESQKSLDNPYRDYYFWKDGTEKNGKKLPPNNWTSFFTGPAWKYDKTTNQWYLHLFAENQPDLNYGNPKVIEEIKKILHFWLKKGVDGFRCDVITLLDKAQGLPDGKKRIALTGMEHYLDGAKMEDILGELQRDALSKYDAFTVGESVFIDVNKALRYTDENTSFLNTVFAFDHISCDNYFGIKQLVKKFNLKQLKKCLTTWQNGLVGKSWNTLFFENHDQARIVGRYTSDTEYRVEGAKLLATILFTLSGTPFVYQGQEIGTTSIRMKNINDYKDVESHNSFKVLKKIFGEKNAMKRIAYCSRDNARTPVQWNDKENAGFSTASTTWLPVNPNYKEINVEKDKKDENSVYNYYKKLIALRKSNQVFVFGTYKDLKPNSSKILCYIREFEDKKLFVVTNFTTKDLKFRLPSNLPDGFVLATSNYPDSPNTPTKCVLRPYEAIVYKLN